MKISHRHYLFVDDGLRRIPQRIIDGLCLGRDALPEYAGTRQKSANVSVELENRRPVRIVKVEGTYFHFDEKGQVHKALAWSGIEALEIYRALQAAKQESASDIIDLTPQMNRRKWERETFWTLSKEQLELIAVDVLGKTNRIAKR